MHSTLWLNITAGSIYIRYFIYRLAGAARAEGTRRSHNRIIKDVTNFLAEQGVDPSELDEVSIMSFLMKVYQEERPFGYTAAVKGAIHALMAALGLPASIWSLAVERVFQGTVRIAAPRRMRRPRVQQLPGYAIRRMVEWVIPVWPRNTQELDQIQLRNFRTVILLVTQFYTLCRISDARKLRARDVKLLDLDGTPAIEIFFRQQKNDQIHIGNKAYIVKEGGAACPYTLYKLYFARNSYYFRDGKTEDLNFLFPRLKMAKITRILIPDGRYAVSENTLVTNIKAMAKKVGFSGVVSGKSAKIGGTSAAFASGLSDAEVRDKGRWRSLESAQHYRRISDSHNLKLAKAFSIQRSSITDNRNPRVFNPEILFTFSDQIDDDVALDQRLFPDL